MMNSWTRMIHAIHDNYNAKCYRLGI